MGSQVEIYGKLYSKSSYQHLLVKYHSLGYEELVEESAYLWFNRLTALAYMELHDCFTEHMIFRKEIKGNRIFWMNTFKLIFSKDAFRKARRTSSATR